MSIAERRKAGRNSRKGVAEESLQGRRRRGNVSTRVLFCHLVDDTIPNKLGQGGVPSHGHPRHTTMIPEELAVAQRKRNQTATRSRPTIPPNGALGPH